MRPHQIRWERFRQVRPTVRNRSVLRHGVQAMADAAAAAGAVVSQAEAFGLHDPALKPRDEAVFALYVAAEVERELL